MSSETFVGSSSRMTNQYSSYILKEQSYLFFVQSTTMRAKNTYPIPLLKFSRNDMVDRYYLVVPIFPIIARKECNCSSPVCFQCDTLIVD